MKKILILFTLLLSISIITALPNDSGNKINFNYPSSTFNNNTANVNHSLTCDNATYLQGYTPFDLPYLSSFTESDPLSLHLNKDNWNLGSDWLTYSNPTLDFNQSKLATHYFNHTTFEVVNGTPAGSINEIDLYDDISYNITEHSGSPGLDFRVNFTGITAFNSLVWRYKSIAGETHITQVQLFDYGTNTWEDYAQLSEVGSYIVKQVGVFDGAEHISGGVVQLRFLSSSNGNTNHIHYFDWITIANGYATPSGAEIDPYSVHTNTVNSTEFDLNSGFNINLIWLTSFVTNLLSDYWNSTQLLNGTLVQNNSSPTFQNITYSGGSLRCIPINGACDLTINHSECCNATGMYEIG